VEATPGIEPEYTVLQTIKEPFPNPLALTRFPPNGEKEQGKQTKVIAVH
jgi:hypothetical protein